MDGLGALRDRSLPAVPTTSSQSSSTNLPFQDPGPSAIGGDINGDPAAFPTLHKQLKAGNWHDVGDMEQFTGHPHAQPTCQARIGGRETRRDYFFVNSACLDLVQSFHVTTLPGITTHKVIDIVINTATTGPSTKKLKMPTHAADLFETKIAEELAALTKDDTTLEKLTTEIDGLEIIIAELDAELREASIKRSSEAAV